ncbi:hypothetical protein BE11_13515 [Sorangium cellulosum]|nr:hypothetical protein BE11_13515 [Sorangium cellulosum]
MREVLAAEAEPRERGLDGHPEAPGDLGDLLALADHEEDDALPGSEQPELVQEIARLNGPWGDGAGS